MLDDLNVVNGRDKTGVLGAIADEYKQASMDCEVLQPEHDGRKLSGVVLICTEEAAMSAEIIKTWLYDRAGVPVEVACGGRIPKYAGGGTLVIAVDVAGDDGGVAAGFSRATAAGAQTAIVTSGGYLLKTALEADVAVVKLSDRLRAGLSVIAVAKAIASLLVNFGVISKDAYGEFAAAGDKLRIESESWNIFSDMGVNYAKQLAIEAHGKTCVVFSEPRFALVGEYWAGAWTRGSQLAISRLYGASEKKFDSGDVVMLGIRSSFGDAGIKVGREIEEVGLMGDTLLEQLLLAVILGDYVGAYLAVMLK